MHLALEALYGGPRFVHANFLIAFARQAAVPSIANVLCRNGHGDIVVDPGRRNDLTMTFFGEFVRLGHESADGIAAIKLMERIHDRFPITAEEKLYTLAVMMFDSRREIDYLGARRYSQRVTDGLWHFWRGMARHMSLGEPAATPQELHNWMIEFERRNYAPSAAGHAVAQALMKDWERWFPRPLKRRSHGMMLAVWDDQLRSALQLPDPPRWATKLMRFQAQQLMITAPYRVVPVDRTWTRQWGRRFGADFRLDGLDPMPSVTARPTRPAPAGRAS